MPDRDAYGFPVVTAEQARRDADQTTGQVVSLMAATCARVEVGNMQQAMERIEQARAALDWLADRLAIAEGGPLGRVPRSGATDTPA